MEELAQRKNPLAERFCRRTMEPILELRMKNAAYVRR